MKVIIVLFFFVFFLYSKTYDLKEVYNLAFAINEDYQISQFENKIKNKEVDKSLSSFYPQVRIDGKYIRKNEFPVIVDGIEEERRKYRRDIVLNIDQVIYDRSKYLDYKIKSNDFSQSILTQTQEKQKLMFEVIKYYFETLFKAKQIDLANQKLKRLEKILQRAKYKYKSGFISKANYLESKAQKDELLTQKLSLELDFNLSKSYLEKLTGIENIEIKKNINLKK
ncbi:TolC family protein [Malaciobacter mytili]|uniref:TolC family protein n=1 Tax=Malaciobacter mytili TaxID=603050 RepID=UPI003BB099E3